MRRLAPVSAFLVAMVFIVMLVPSCETTKPIRESWESALGPVPTKSVNPRSLHSECNVRVDLIKANRFGRKGQRPMKPQFITIHSTQNYTGDAHAHAKALKRGALKGGVIGYLAWHFTVQQDCAIQHIPTNERGEHADFDGPGNRYSIGIEMCEHEGNSLPQTVERTAKLTASLMYHHKISIDNVVPHYHWPRRGYNPANKNCPHFLLEGGHPRANWSWFKSRVNGHYQRILKYQKENPPPPPPSAPPTPEQIQRYQQQIDQQRGGSPAQKPLARRRESALGDSPKVG
ncbi:MAG: N-acetylmuramoyl-L-alanine amidase [Verrucomicrobiota bacterium]